MKLKNGKNLSQASTEKERRDEENIFMFKLQLQKVQNKEQQ